MSNMSGIVKSIQNIICQDTGLNGDAQRIEKLGLDAYETISK